MNIYKSRLLNVVKALRESPRPQSFTMKDTGGICGTPHCAIGHYAARRDLQNDFHLTFFGRMKCRERNWNVLDLAQHFGLSLNETYLLFGSDGCNNAQNPAEAIEYIEGFMDRKWPADPGVTKLKEQLAALT